MIQRTRLANIIGNWVMIGLVSILLVPCALAQSKATPAAKKGKKSATKAAKTVTPAATGTPAVKPASDTLPAPVEKRDPFQSLVGITKQGPVLPPGKAGLQVSTVRVDGTVRSPGGMMAVVSNPQQRVYFVHEGDRLYDGSVEKIGLDGVVFRENTKDAFGKPIEREVVKRIYSSAGEQQ
jgi:hypothetical protein